MLTLLTISLLLLPFLHANDETVTQTRTAVLRQFLTTGLRNVRYETMANPVGNTNGQSGSTAGMKTANGTAVFGCLDTNKRKNADGNDYERPNGHFVYRCKDDVEEVVACIGSERTKNATIAVGKTLDVDGFWHKCESFPNKSVVYTQEPSCSHNDKEYHIGDKLTVGFLRMQCEESGYKVIGCYYKDDSGNEFNLEKGEKKESGKNVHYCEDKGDSLQYFAKVNGCTANGTQYKEGEEFKRNHLRFKCSNGMTDILDCYIDDNRPLKVGQDIVENNMVHRCYRQGGRIEYTEHSCGVPGSPSCTPPAIPNTAENAPQSGHGVGTFAIVQTIGDSKTAQSGSLKIELDKLLASHQ
jgi:hypothetical protein